jgi:hypothetical protein
MKLKEVITATPTTANTMTMAGQNSREVQLTKRQEHSSVPRDAVHDATVMTVITYQCVCVACTLSCNRRKNDRNGNFINQRLE